MLNTCYLLFVTYLLFVYVFKQGTLSPPVSVQAAVAEMHTQPSPVITLLQAPPENTNPPEPVSLLSKHVITHPEKLQAAEGCHTPPNQAFIHHPLQVKQVVGLLGI